MTPVVSTASPIDWHSLPKALLHEHLDGGLRATTLFETCAAAGVSLPAADAQALAAWMRANADSGSLELYLRGFGLTLRAMASPAACERVAFEAAEDARLDGCVLAEFRIAPLLLEAFGLAGEAAVESMLAGLARCSMPSGLIVCALRSEGTDHSLRAARLAARYRDAGVVGFDLAGAERGYPPTEHERAIGVARDAGLGLTLHAGEADSGERVFEAAALGARRIGHGVQVVDDPRWLDRARELALHFEVCPTSNVHTGAAASLERHPIKRMVEAGLEVSCSTDNRLMSGVTLSSELEALHREAGLPLDALRAMMLRAARASFLSAEVRERAAARIEAGFGAP